MSDLEDETPGILIGRHQEEDVPEAEERNEDEEGLGGLLVLLRLGRRGELILLGTAKLNDKQPHDLCEEEDVYLSWRMKRVKGQWVKD